MEETRNVQNFGENVLEDRGRGGRKDNIKMDVRIVGCEDANVNELREDHLQWWALVVSRVVLFEFCCSLNTVK
jgi:hypothetical protein